MTKHVNIRSTKAELRVEELRYQYYKEAWEATYHKADRFELFKKLISKNTITNIKDSTQLEKEFAKYEQKHTVEIREEVDRTIKERFEKEKEKREASAANFESRFIPIHVKIKD